MTKPIWESSGQLTIEDAFRIVTENWGRRGSVRITSYFEGPPPTLEQRVEAQLALAELAAREPKLTQIEDFSPDTPIAAVRRHQSAWHLAHDEWRRTEQQLRLRAYPFRYGVGRPSMFGSIDDSPSFMDGDTWEDAFAKVGVKLTT